MRFSARAGRRVAAAVIGLLAVPMLAPAPAQADKLWFSDRRGDVQKLDFASDTFEFLPAPRTRNGDISSVFIHYRKGRLVVRTNFVDLKVGPRTMFGLTGVIRTNEHRRFLFAVDTTWPKRAGHDMMVDFHGKEPCEIGHRMVYDEKFVRVVVPLDCIGDPRWVQLQLAAGTFFFDTKALRDGKIEEGDIVVGLDDATSDSMDLMGRWTPRVRRH